MLSPHLSLPPLDFAAAGLITLTNNFRTKDENMLQRISSDLTVKKPFADDLVQGLREDVQLSTNITLRQIGADLF